MAVSSRLAELDAALDCIAHTTTRQVERYRTHLLSANALDTFSLLWLSTSWHEKRLEPCAVTCFTDGMHFGSVQGSREIDEIKVTVEVDCTPEEARQFMGLPDVQPMQAAVMAEMEKRVLAEMGRFSPEAVLKSWMSVIPQGPEQMQAAFMKIFQHGSATGKPPAK